MKKDINAYKPFKDREEHDFYKMLGRDIKDLKDCVRQGRYVVNKANMLIMHISDKVDDYFNSQMSKRRKEDER